MFGKISKIKFIIKQWPIIKADAIRTYTYHFNISPNDVKLTKIGYIKLVLKLFRQNLNGFRDVFYYRTCIYNRLFRFLFPITSELHIDVKDVAGGGIVLHHAFSTYLNAEHIGYGCSFRNNTTLGNKLNKEGVLGRPYLKNNVFCGPNVVVIGDIVIGNNVVIGAGAVVTKSVPDNCVVVGNPAYIIKQDGIRCYKKL